MTSQKNQQYNEKKLLTLFLMLKVMFPFGVFKKCSKIVKLMSKFVSISTFYSIKLQKKEYSEFSLKIYLNGGDIIVSFFSVIKFLNTLFRLQRLFKIYTS